MAQNKTIENIIEMLLRFQKGDFTGGLENGADASLNSLVKILNDTAKVLAKKNDKKIADLDSKNQVEQNLGIEQKKIKDKSQISVDQKTLQMQKLIDGVPAQISHWDVRLKNLAANSLYAKQFGKMPEEILGQNYKDIVGPSFPWVFPNVQKALFGQESSLHTEVQKADGTLGYMQVTFKPEISDGKVVGFFTMGVDVTALKNAESEAAHKARQIRDAESLAKIGSCEWDLKSNTQSWSSEYFHIFEIAETVAQGEYYQLYRSRIHPDDLQKLENLIERAKINGEGFLFNHRLIFEKGSRVKFVRSIGKIQKDIKGSVVAISVTCQDLTELVETQEENRFVLDALQIGVWQYSSSDQSLVWDETMHRVFDIKEEDFSGHFNAWENSLAPESRLKAIEEFNIALKGEKEFDIVYKIYTKSKGKRYISSRGRVLRGKDGLAVMMFGISFDVTEQKVQEKQIAEHQNQLELISDNTTGPVSKISRLGRFVFANKLYEEWFGIPREKIIGRTHEEILPSETYKYSLPYIKRAQSGERVSFEGTVRTVDGKELFTHTTLIPYLNSEGFPDGFFTVVHDITDIKEAQLKMEQTSKLASLGEISAGIAHEINNPLAIISGSVDILGKFINHPEKLNSKIEVIKKSCERITKIIDGLRKFSRTGDANNYSTHALSDIVNEVLVLAEVKSKKFNTPITAEINARGLVDCNDIEIEQVLVNLINNAVDAIKNQNEKWVKIIVFEDDQTHVIRIIDAGPGIPIAVQNKLFQPFFTTKKVGEGTGLGLSITRGILERHKATITILSDFPNTCFELRFPKSVELKVVA